MIEPNTQYSNQTINLDHLPDLIDITLNPLHPKYPTITVIHTAIAQLIFLAIFTTAFFIANLPKLLWILMISEIVLALSWSYVSRLSDETQTSHHQKPTDKKENTESGETQDKTINQGQSNEQQ